MTSLQRDLLSIKITKYPDSARDWIAWVHIYLSEIYLRIQNYEIHIFL